VRYLLKMQHDRGNHRRAIMDVNQGGAPMTGEIARKVVQFFRKPRPPPRRKAKAFPAREEEILNLLARGFVTKESPTSSPSARYRALPPEEYLRQAARPVRNGGRW